MEMSVRQTPSPLQRPAATAPATAAGPSEDVPLPKGHCRYILLQAEIKGQRCACVNFQHNKSLPGTTCDCGHLSCFHNAEHENAEQKQELELLKKRLQVLEAHMSKGSDDVVDKVVSRMAEVEEVMERNKEDVDGQLKQTYRNIQLAWGVIDQGKLKHQQHDEQFRQIYDKLRSHEERMQRIEQNVEDRHLELQDADMSLEERIENLYETLEEEEPFSSGGREAQRRRRSTSDSSRPTIATGPLGPLGGEARLFRRAPPTSTFPYQAPAPLGHSLANEINLNPLSRIPPTLMIPPSRRPRVSAPSTAAWTVHISLLPQAGLAMPFEKGTNAYQRCLSRGLHRMVAIGGTDEASFVAAVSRAFGDLLRDRPWIPLEAKLCDTEPLQGLPMLRRLDPALEDGPYDAEFLRRHCAVCDANGMIDSLYIAMRNHSLSWLALRNAPKYLDGLESSWTYDPLIDHAPFEDDTVESDSDQPAAGEITIPSLNSSLKRGASEISRSNSFGAASAPVVEVEGSLPKRNCPAQPLRRRGVETA